MRDPDKNDIVYIAGPMTGYEGFNFKMFDRVAEEVRVLFGCSVVNPAEVDRATATTEWIKGVSKLEATKHFIHINTATIMTCSMIVLLPGWKDSVGARHELALAERLGLDVIKAEVFVDERLGLNAIYFSAHKK